MNAEVVEGEPVEIRLRSDKPTIANTDVFLVFSEDGDTLVSRGRFRFTMPLGVTEHVVAVDTVNDANRENSSTVTVTVEYDRDDTDRQYEVGGDYTTTVHVQDNEMDSRAPGVPQAFSAISGNGRATLSWRAPIQLGDSRLLRYEVLNLNDGPSAWTRVGTRTSHTVTGLDNGTLYIFRVRAVTASGAGTPSPGVSATPTAQTNPEAPQGLSGDGYDGRVLLTWASPSTTAAPRSLSTSTASERAPTPARPSARGPPPAAATEDTRSPV